jgi:hypothetical protein
VSNAQATPESIGGTCGCAWSASNFNAYVELDLIAGNYQLFVRGFCGANCGGVCSITNDNGNTYSLGADPTGTHNVNFTGDLTGASYSFVIVIS